MTGGKGVVGVARRDRLRLEVGHGAHGMVVAFGRCRHLLLGREANREPPHGRRCGRGRRSRSKSRRGCGLGVKG